MFGKRAHIKIKVEEFRISRFTMFPYRRKSRKIMAFL
jgi:hypothetical protein